MKPEEPKITLTEVKSRVKEGMSQAEVLAAIGKPKSRASRPGGAEEWNYVESFTDVVTDKPYALVSVRFDKDGALLGIEEFEKIITIEQLKSSVTKGMNKVDVIEAIGDPDSKWNPDVEVWNYVNKIHDPETFAAYPVVEVWFDNSDSMDKIEVRKNLISQEEFENLLPKGTPKSKVGEILGSPSSNAQYPSGFETWNYNRKIYDSAAKLPYAVTVIWFNKEGLMDRVDFDASSYLKK